MSNGTINTYSLKDIRRAIIRLTKGDPLWSELKKGFPYGLAQLKQEEFKLRNQKDPDGVALGDQAIQILMDESIARYTLKQRPAITKPSTTIMPKSIYPKPSKTTKTRVASPCGPQAELKGLETPSDCGWVQGLLQKFVPTCEKPYLVRWATKPAVQMQVSQRRMWQLVNNYKYCEEHEVFFGT
jgi:hypothetical protein